MIVLSFVRIKLQPLHMCALFIPFYNERFKWKLVIVDILSLHKMLVSLVQPAIVAKLYMGLSNINY